MLRVYIIIHIQTTLYGMLRYYTSQRAMHPMWSPTMHTSNCLNVMGQGSSGRMFLQLARCQNLIQSPPSSCSHSTVRLSRWQEQEGAPGEACKKSDCLRSKVNELGQQCSSSCWGWKALVSKAAAGLISSRLCSVSESKLGTWVTHFVQQCACR